MGSSVQDPDRDAAAQGHVSPEPKEHLDSSGVEWKGVEEETDEVIGGLPASL